MTRGPSREFQTVQYSLWYYLHLLDLQILRIQMYSHQFVGWESRILAGVCYEEKAERQKYISYSRFE